MTFNQWFATKTVPTVGAKIALEAIWYALTGAGMNPRDVGRMLTDLLDEMKVST